MLTVIENLDHTAAVFAIVCPGEPLRSAYLLSLPICSGLSLISSLPSLWVRGFFRPSNGHDLRFSFVFSKQAMVSGKASDERIRITQQLQAFWRFHGIHKGQSVSRAAASTHLPDRTPAGVKVSGVWPTHPFAQSAPK